MRYYKLKALSVGAKGNRVLRKEDDKTYSEDTWHEKRAEELVGLGFLIRVKEDPIKAEPKSKPKSKPEKEKPEDKPAEVKEESLLDSMKEAGDEENEEKSTEETEISEDDEKKVLLKEAKKLAKEKGIKAPHRLSGIAKLKTFINDNK